MEYPASFAQQFVVSSPGRPPIPGARRLELNSLTLDVFSGLPTSTVRERGGRRIGVLLGWPIDLEAEAPLGAETVLEGDILDPSQIDDFVESFIYRYAGSFIFVLDTAEARRIYLDADGTLSLVYDPQARLAGATAGVLLDRAAYFERFRRDLYQTFDVKHDGWFTVGLTAHAGVERLLCNHYLDLDHWRPVRHWPRAAIPETSDPAAAIEVINETVRRTLRALVKSGRVTVSLTAGNETRALLACAKDLRRELNFVTIDSPGYRLDRVRAEELARRFDLNHHILPARRATEAQAQAWQALTGHCVAGNNMYGHPSVEPLADGFFVGGLGGEVGRGFLWLDADRSTPISAAGILDRLKLPRHPMLIEGVERWLAPLQGYDSLMQLDLAYLELRMSCWAFAQSYATKRVPPLHPLISRRSFAAMLSLPADLRRSNGMIRKCIEQAWPEVLELPINRYGDFRDYLELVERGLRKPHRVWKKILQLSARDRSAA